MAKILLFHKDIDINATNDQGWTALYTAAFLGRTEFIELFRNSEGIDVNIKTKFGWSALFAATYESQIECVHALLTFDDIDVNATTNEGVFFFLSFLFY